MARNCLKLCHGPILSKMVQDGSMWSKMVWNGSGWFKVVQKGPRWSKIPNRQRCLKYWKKYKIHRRQVSSSSDYGQCWCVDLYCTLLKGQCRRKTVGFEWFVDIYLYPACLHHHLSCWYICWISARLFFLVSGTNLKDKQMQVKYQHNIINQRNRPVWVFSDCQRSWSIWLNFYLFWLSNSSKNFFERCLKELARQLVAFVNFTLVSEQICPFLLWSRFDFACLGFLRTWWQRWLREDCWQRISQRSLTCNIQPKVTNSEKKSF